MDFIGIMLVLGGLVAQIPGIAGFIKPGLIRLKTRNQVSVILVGGWIAMVLGAAISSPPQSSSVASTEEKSQPVVVPATPQPPVIDELAQLKTALEQAKTEAEQAKIGEEQAKLEAERFKVEVGQLKTDNEKAMADIARLTADLDQARADQVNAVEQAKSAEAPIEAPAALALLDAAKNDEAPVQPPACKLVGKVISVADGDTITVLDAQKQQHKIRMMGIDAPEKAQPFGNAAQKHLASLVAQKEVCVDWNKEDKYQRKVGKVMLDDVDIDLKMVEAGFAWHFKKYESEQTPEDRELYASAHDKAKSDTTGLWSEPNPIEPDAWRDGARPEKRVAPVMPDKDEQPVKAMVAETSASECGGKRYCKDMSSCAEACHYLNDCGVSRLDRDGDGRPCESLCGRGCN